jgi:opacity protein-like surface antigen
MKLRTIFSVLFLPLTLATVALAGPDKEVVTNEAPPVESTPFQFSGEFTIEQSYVGQSSVRREGRSADFSELYSNLRFVYTPRVKYGIVRIGAQLERYSLDFDGSGRQVPNTLQAVNAVVGFDTRIGDSILVRLEAQPGFYGTTFDHFDGEQFNVPFILGGTYIYSPELQFVLGVGVNIQQKYPVLPGGGVRWKIAPKWVLNAVLPTPHLEYQVNDKITAFVGADIKANTFRVDDRFGASHGDTGLNSAWLSYEEIRAGAGFDWKVSSNITLRVEGGYSAYHDFDYHRTQVHYHNESGAPYASLMLEGSF